MKTARCHGGYLAFALPRDVIDTNGVVVGKTCYRFCLKCLLAYIERYDIHVILIEWR